MAKRKRLATTAHDAPQIAPISSSSCDRVPYEVWLLIFTQLHYIEPSSIRAITLVSRAFNTVVAPVSCKTLNLRRRASLLYEVPLPSHHDVFIERTRHVREIAIANAVESPNLVPTLQIDVGFLTKYLQDVRSIRWRRCSPGPTALEQMEFHRLWPKTQFCLHILGDIYDPDQYTFLQPVLWRSPDNLFSLELNMERPFDTRLSSDQVLTLEYAVTKMVNLRVLKLFFYMIRPAPYVERLDASWAFSMDRVTRFPPLKHLSLRGVLHRRNRTYTSQFFDWSQIEELVLLDCDEWDILETITSPPPRLRVLNIEDGFRCFDQTQRSLEERQRNILGVVSATDIESLSVRAMRGCSWALRFDGDRVGHVWISYPRDLCSLRYQEISDLMQTIMPRAATSLKELYICLEEPGTDVSNIVWLLCQKH